jgi:hypothetical protein
MLRSALVLGCLVLGLMMAPAANAASTTQILRDCADDGILQGDYSPRELRKARQDIPADTDQYTNCRDVLARAAARAVSGGGNGQGGDGGGGTGAGGPGGGGGGGGDADRDLVRPTTPDDYKILNDAQRPLSNPLEVGGKPVISGANGFAAGIRNDIPATLLVVLGLIGVAALAGAVLLARRARGTREIATLFRRHVLRRA